MSRAAANQADIGTATPAGEPGQAVPFADAYRELRADADIQFDAPVMDVPEVIPPTKPPAWLEALLEFLGDLFEPIGRFLGGNWSAVELLLLVGGVALAATILYKLATAYISDRKLKNPEASEVEAEWTPDRDAALALLDEADRLAAEGRYDEAAHLLLQRSVGHIAAARPDLLQPSSTSREIGSFASLSERARGAFAIISGHVERSLFAMRGLTRDDWLQSRNAYADFALADLGHGN